MIKLRQGLTPPLYLGAIGIAMVGWLWAIIHRRGMALWGLGNPLRAVCAQDVLSSRTLDARQVCLIA